MEAISSESLSKEAKKDELSTGRVWTAGFHHVTAHSYFARFKTYEQFTSISLILKFFSIAVNRG
jgi:hypothetical protein